MPTVREKDATRLLQGAALVVSRLIELQIAQSAGSAAESRWNNASTSSSSNSQRPTALPSLKPPPLPTPGPAAEALRGTGLATPTPTPPSQPAPTPAASVSVGTAAADFGGGGSAAHEESGASPQTRPEAAARGGAEAERPQPAVEPSEAAPSQVAGTEPSHRPPVGGRRSSSVPTNPIMRVAQFGMLGLGMGAGLVGEAVRRTVAGTVTSGGGLKGMMLSEENSDRLTQTLCRMRGASLKFGQLLSIQDEHVIPKDSPLRQVIDRVREEAENMPPDQLAGVMRSELGPDWRSKFREFDMRPFAAASIGQVHRGVTEDGVEVAVKVQYPGVADSIDADIGTLRVLIAPFAPKGLFLRTALDELKGAMRDECDYAREADMTERMSSLLRGDPDFGVPGVVRGLSSGRVLTTTMVAGIPIDRVAEMPQATRDAVARAMLRLTLRELFELRTMQTDPNWSNFLYDASDRRVNLIDFGACVEYPAAFCAGYGRLVRASSERDKEGVLRVSREMGFLTGEESPEFLDAHAAAAFITGEPFRGGAYDFGSCGMTERNSQHIAVMLAGRKTPPPREVYTLHRKLSGAFLACMRLRAHIECRSLLDQYLPPAPA